MMIFPWSSIKLRPDGHNEKKKGRLTSATLLYLQQFHIQRAIAGPLHRGPISGRIQIGNLC